MLFGPTYSVAGPLRVRVRVKKWRVRGRSWTPGWKGLVYGSSVISVGLAAFFIWMLLQMLADHSVAHMPSALTAPVQWLASSFKGVKASAVPEPSRAVLVFVSLAAAMLGRRR